MKDLINVVKLDEVASADSEKDVATWRYFCPPQPDPPDAESSAALFSRFRAAVPSQRDAASLTRSVETALAPIRARGLLGWRGPRPISPHAVEILVYPAGRLSEAKPVKLSAVRLGDGRSLRLIERTASGRVVHAREPGASLWRLAYVRVLSWFPVEWLL